MCQGGKDRVLTKAATGRAALPAHTEPDDYLDALSVAFEEAIDQFEHFNNRGLDYDTVTFVGGLTTYEIIIEIRDGL